MMLVEDRCAPLHYAVDNITRYVFEKLGERCAMSSIVLPTAVIYGLILLLGLLGNVCTCLVILRNKCMQNPTNYYLFSLAISDLLVLVLGLPMELYGVFDVVYPYKFGEFVCKGRAFLIEFTSYASILTITCFSVERWLAICFPLRIKLFSTLDRAVKMIITVWFCAFLAASPVLSIVVVNKLPVPEWAIGQPWLPLVSEDGESLMGTDTCAMDFKRPLAQRNFIFSAFFVFFLLPALLITIVYCHIVYRLCATTGRNSSQLMVEQAKQRSRRGVLKILVSVVVMFFLCWLPFHVQRLLSVYLNEVAETASDSEQPYSSAIYALFSVVFYISGYCYYSNSACNPILYNILSAKYRMAFCKTILGDRLTYKLLRDRCHFGSTAFGASGCTPGGLHSHLHSKWSTASMQRQTTISPKMSSVVARATSAGAVSTTLLKSQLHNHNDPHQNLAQLCGEALVGISLLAAANGRLVVDGNCSTNAQQLPLAMWRRSLRRAAPARRTTNGAQNGGGGGSHAAQMARKRASERSAEASWRRLMEAERTAMMKDGGEEDGGDENDERDRANQ